MTQPDEALIAELRRCADNVERARNSGIAEHLYGGEHIEMRRAADRIEALSGPTVPDREGVASVPVKPTQAMVDAALRCHWSANLGERIRTIYAVMIDASRADHFADPGKPITPDQPKDATHE